MVKVYFSYQFCQTISQPISRHCNFITLPKLKLLISGINQYICIINLKTGQPIKYIFQNQRNINVRVITATQTRLYVGYQDGKISIYQLQTWQYICSLDLHKSTVSSLAVDDNDTKLISAGLDGHIFVWDLLTQESQKIKSAHLNGITQIIYKSIIINNKPQNIIFSLGKDGFFKIWNADSLLCINAISTNTTEAFSMVYYQEKGLVYIGTNKEDIPILRINKQYNKNNQSNNQNNQSCSTLCEIVGVIKRNNFCRCVQMSIDNHKMYILNSQKKLEIYELLSEQKLLKKKKRQISRKKQKQRKNNNNNQEQEEQDQIIANVQQQQQFNEYQNSITFLQQKTFLTKVYNFQILNNKLYYNNGTNICLLPLTPSPSLLSLQQQPSQFQSKYGYQLTTLTPQTLQLQLQFPYLIQLTPQSIIIYNSLTLTKLYSIQQKSHHIKLFGGYLMICTQQQIKVHDLNKNQIVYSRFEKYNGSWVNKTNCLLWNDNLLKVNQIGYDKHKQIKMKQIMIKYLDEKITQAMYTHDYNKYAVSLQNCQIHLFFADTGKQFLKLYGHKLPITHFDISSDNSLLVSCSVDKDIRLWDMDFGHCIKSIFAHQLPLTNVKFIKDTHYIITTSKDAHVKFWDGDTHQLIQDFQQSMLQLKALAVTDSGDNIFAGGLDGGFRVYKQTNNQTIASDQQDKKMQKVMIQEYAVHKFQSNQDKTRYQDLKHGQQIIQALQQNQQPLIILKLLKSIPSGNLKSSLSFLHTHHYQKLQQYLQYFIDHKYQEEICFRILDNMGRSTELGNKMKKTFTQMSQVLAVNREVIKLMLRTVKQQKNSGF